MLAVQSANDGNLTGKNSFFIEMSDEWGGAKVPRVSGQVRPRPI